MGVRTPSGRFLGGKISMVDTRDHLYPAKLTRGLLEVPPPVRMSRKANFPPCWNQTSLGACTAHAGAARLWELYPGFMASRLAAYYSGRWIEGSINSDSGVYTRDLMKVLQAGVIAEEAWAYDINQYQSAPPTDYQIERRGITSYSRLQTRDELVDFIANEGSVIFTFQVPSYFDANFIAQTGVFMSPSGKPTIIAGHCVDAIGYDLDFRNSADFAMLGVQADLVEDEMALVRNSWGQDWALDGYFWMPISYLLHPTYGNDAWATHQAPAASVGSVPITGSFQTSG